MDVNDFYEEICIELCNGIEGYLNGHLQLSDLYDISFKEFLCRNFENKEEIKQNLKVSISKLLAKMTLEINTIEKLNNQLKAFKDEEVDVDLDEILAHGMLLGRNRAPPAGAECSQFYTGPFKINKQN